MPRSSRSSRTCAWWRPPTSTRTGPPGSREDHGHGRGGGRRPAAGVRAGRGLRLRAALRPRPPRAGAARRGGGAVRGEAARRRTRRSPRWSPSGSRESGALCRVGHHWRCAEPVARARELLQDRPVRLVNGWWLDKVPPVPWWTDRALSGGPIIEQAVHVLDLARFLVGEVEQVCALAAAPLGPGRRRDRHRLGPGFPRRRGRDDDHQLRAARANTGPGWRSSQTDSSSGSARTGWRSGTAPVQPERTTFDPWTARVAADRRFVDALHGRPVTSTRHHPTTPRRCGPTGSPAPWSVRSRPEPWSDCGDRPCPGDRVRRASPRSGRCPGRKDR